jgi:predicted N-acetyltransferase YhbS
MFIRRYCPEDYEHIVGLYHQGNLYGGQFDENRDSAERLKKKTIVDPDSILVCEDKGKICGTVSLIEDARVAWLFRFAVLKSENEKEIAALLYNQAIDILRKRGHKQVLLYSPSDNDELAKRYEGLGLVKGATYTCFWSEIK